MGPIQAGSVTRPVTIFGEGPDRCGRTSAWMAMDREIEG